MRSHKSAVGNLAKLLAFARHFVIYLRREPGSNVEVTHFSGRLLQFFPTFIF